MKAVLSDINWSSVQRKIGAETKNREVYQPLVSLYRWWARRPHSLIGAILDAGAKSDAANTLVVDPFSGGGTVAIEAIRRGLRVYAQDVNPWAAWGLKVSLAPVCPDALARAGDMFLEALRKAEGHRYTGPDDSTTVHTFRVRRAQCSSCARSAWCFPYALVSVASRSLNEEHGFFGCRACGSVTKHRLDAVAPRCSDCGVTYSDRGMSYCPHCHIDEVSEAARRVACHEVVLVQRWREVPDGPMVYLDHPTDREVSRTRRSSPLAASLASHIPRGHETNKLRRAGFRTWASLYPSRQFEVLVRAAQLLTKMDFDPMIRDRVRLCLAGATEMPGHLCRWDRYHPKVFEALSNHRYSFDGLAVEPNPLAPVGRGSLTRRLRASVLAARMLAEVTSPKRTVVYLRTDTDRIADANQAVTITQGSSEKLLLPDRCGSIIVTDPPYCGEGISLHTVCHHAIYVDRTFNAAHYLQSIDRIHRLGLSPNQETRVSILEATTTVDARIATRLKSKIDVMSAILNDPGLAALAYDPEDVEEPFPAGVEAADVEEIVEHLTGNDKE